MPLHHKQLLEEYGTTLAIIDKDRQPEHLTLEEYWRDAIHRHAHRFADQEPRTIFKYSTSARRTRVTL